MFDADCAVLTEHGYVRAAELRPGERLINPFGGAPGRVRRVTRRHVALQDVCRFEPGALMADGGRARPDGPLDLVAHLQVYAPDEYGRCRAWRASDLVVPEVRLFDGVDLRVEGADLLVVNGVVVEMAHAPICVLG